MIIFIIFIFRNRYNYMKQKIIKHFYLKCKKNSSMKPEKKPERKT